MKYRTISLILFILLISACNKSHRTHSAINKLPQAVTNNAVALVNQENGLELYSFNGLSSGKTWQDINNTGYRYSKNKWQQLNMPETSQKVLASTAVSIGTKVYLIGGYTVDANKQEKSMPEIFVLDTLSQKWSTATTMPVPVDDTVALVYANRYIYLISGWHDDDNVSLVQVYDTQDDSWFNASDYPAPAVFGHAGGIVKNQMIVCDGVKVVTTTSPRKFVSSPICMKGVINESQPQLVDWQVMAHHSGTAYYRMAATDQESHHRVVFAGGSNNPYNYNGMGYNGIASEASALIYVYDVNTEKWQQHKNIIGKNMDHRALLNSGDWFYIIAGMESEQKVSNKVIKFKLPQ